MPPLWLPPAPPLSGPSCTASAAPRQVALETGNVGAIVRSIYRSGGEVRGCDESPPTHGAPCLVRGSYHGEDRRVPCRTGRAREPRRAPTAVTYRHRASSRRLCVVVVFELQWANSSGGFTFDYDEVSTGDGATTATTSATTTTIPTSTPSSGGVTTTEAEAIPHSGSCWSVYFFGRFSGGAGRTCYSPNASLAWTVSTGAGPVVRLYGCRDGASRGCRVSVDGSAWTSGTLTGADAFSALFFTSAALSASSHQLQLQWADSGGGFTFDYDDVSSGGGGTTPNTPTTSATTGTTVAPPTGVCAISPGDRQSGITAAIQGCPTGSTVTFPRNRVYRQSDFIDVADRSNLVIDGGGSTLINSAANGDTARTGASCGRAERDVAEHDGRRKLHIYRPTVGTASLERCRQSAELRFQSLRWGRCDDF